MWTEIRLSTDLVRVSSILREEDARLPGEMRRTLTRTVKPYVRELKQNARQIPVRGARHTGLRRRVAAGVYAQVRTTRSPGVTIRTRMADPTEAVIPRGLDSQQGWRHPVFGNTDNWVRQTTGGSWFREPLANKRNDIARALNGELQNMAERIDRAT